MNRRSNAYEVPTLSLCAFFAFFVFPLVAQEPLTIRVLSFNIRHGEGTDQKVDIARAARVIAEAKPDLVALQEVDVKVNRSGNVDQPAELARLTKMNVAFGKSIDFDGGQFGNAVLSRWPIAWAKTSPIEPLAREEKRSLLIADIDLPSPHANLTLLSTQFDHGRRHNARNKAADAVVEFAEILADDPAILGADFFAALDSEPVSRIEQEWTVANVEFVPTTPANEPKEQRHFALYRPADRFEVVDVKVLEEPLASQHRPVLATLKLRPKATKP